MDFVKYVLRWILHNTFRVAFAKPLRAQFVNSGAFKSVSACALDSACSAMDSGSGFAIDFPKSFLR
jgi:hypothetical protein